MRSERELKMKKNLKEKIEKRLVAEMSAELRESLGVEIRKELTQQISEELKAANEKELTALRRKLEAKTESKQNKLVSQQANEFDVRVKQQVQAQLELKEKEIARKHKLLAAKEKQ